MARLTTHVLDTSRGKPAEGVIVDLYAIRDDERMHLMTVATNKDGRTDEPLLAGDRIAPGVYELMFHAGRYFRREGAELANPPFLDEVVIRFGLADPTGDYHVPVLLAPFGYSTYRGS